jgi:uncharacterized protein YoxC
MIIDICVGVIALAFVVLVVYLVLTLIKVIRLLKTTNDIALDFKKKSEALNVFLQPLKKLDKKKIDLKHRKYDKIAEIINFATDGIALFNTLKKK